MGSCSWPLTSPSKHLLSQLALVLLTPIVTVFIYPILIAVFVPVWIFRKLVDIVAHLLDPSLGPILCGMDALYAGPKPYEKPLQIVATGCVLKSKLGLPRMREIMKNKLFLPTGAPLFPQLTQKVVRRFGYNFWTNDTSFILEHHTRHLNPEDPDTPVTRSSLKALLANKIPYLPFSSEHSPWQMILIEDFIDENDPSVKSLVIFHYNHCLWDGFSGMKLTQVLSLSPWKFQGPTEPPILKKWIGKLTLTLQMLLTGPYHILNVFFFSNDSNVLLKKNKTTNEHLEMQELDLLPLTRLKSVKNKESVCVSSVIITMAAEATRAMLELQEGKRFKRIHSMIALTLPDHPEGLTNHWSFVKMPIIFSPDGDLSKTLKNVDREYKKVVNSALPFVCFYFTKLLGMLPVWAQGNAEDYVSCSFVISNFPGPNYPVDLLGCICEEVFIAASFWKGTAVAFSSVAVNGKLRLCCGSMEGHIRHKGKEGEITAIEAASDALKMLELGQKGSCYVNGKIKKS